MRASPFLGLTSTPAAESPALHNLICEVCPGSNPPGGMGKVEGGMADLTVRVGDCQRNYYIAPKPSLKKMKSTAMWSEPRPGAECKPGKPTEWTWTVTVAHPNQNIHVTFMGEMPLCDPPTDDPDDLREVPTFNGIVVHTDLDVDSDNDNLETSSSDPGFQRQPKRSDAEDEVEESELGLVLCVNRAFEEGSEEAEDFAVDGIAADDPDLAIARYEVVGSDGEATFAIPENVRLWRASDSGFVEIPSGTPVAFTEAEGEAAHELFIEGISHGTGTITVTFDPNDDHSDEPDDSVDVITFTVVDFLWDTLNEPQDDRTVRNNRPGEESSCFAYNGATESKNVIMLSGRIAPAIPAELAQALFGECRVRFHIDPVSTSHADSNDRLQRGEDAEVTWADPLGSGNNANHTIGEIDFTTARYDAGSGEWFTGAMYIGLPLVNSEFGEKRMFLRKGEDESRTITEKPFHIFFPPGNQVRGRYEHNHADPDVQGFPIGLTANWFFYWSQQQAGDDPAVCQYEYGALAPQARFLQRNKDSPGALGSYTFSNKHLVLHNRAAALDEFDAAGSFNGGKPMPTSIPGRTITAGFSADTAPEIVNITYAHELTHHTSQTAAANGMDTDGDGVPDEWEEMVGMNPRGVTISDRDVFSGSRGNDNRDQELYAWISACFQPAYNGAYTVEPALTGGVTYLGEVPEQANNDADWSEGGVQWQRLCGEAVE